MRFPETADCRTEQILTPAAEILTREARIDANSHVIPGVRNSNAATGLLRDLVRIHDRAVLG